MPTLSYPFDQTGLAPTNLVTDEYQALQSVNGRNYYMVIPKCAPFFANDHMKVQLDNGSQITDLKEGQDYYLCLPYVAASRSLGKMLYGGIMVLNTALNGNVLLTYQTIGGKWVTDTSTVLEALGNMVYGPRTATWDVLTNVPEAFPPIVHSVDVDEIYGQEELVKAILKMAKSISEVDRSGDAHFLNFNNPHNVTKEQVFLGSVEDLPVASEVDLIEKKRVRKYVTLSQVLRLLEEAGIEGMEPSDGQTVNVELSSASSVNEDEDLAVTVTTNLPNNTVLYWKISHSGTDASDMRFTSGQFTVNGGQGQFVVRAVDDEFWENPETFIVQIKDSPAPAGTVLAASGVISLINKATGGVTTIEPEQNTVNEGGSVVLNVQATRRKDGTKFTWRVKHITTMPNDFVEDSGSVFIYQNAATFELETTTDSIYEDSKTFKVELFGPGGALLATSSLLTLHNSTEVPTYKLTIPSTKVDEGGSFSVSVETTNLQNGTDLYWVVNHVGTAAGDFVDTRGTVKVQDNNAFFTIPTVETPYFTAGKTFNVAVKTGGYNGQTKASSTTLTIVDTTQVTHRVEVESNNVGEGQQIKGKIITTGLNNGTLLYWKVVHGTTVAADFKSGNLSGSTAVVGNEATFTINTVKDFANEASEVFQIYIMEGSATGTVVATVSSLTISNVAPTASYTIAPSNGTLDNTGAIVVDEGTTLNLAISGTSDPFLSATYWKVVHDTTTANDFNDVQGMLSMAANDTSTLNLPIKADPFYTGDKTFTIRLYSDNARTVEVGRSPTIKVVDKTTPTYSIAAIGDPLKERDSLRINITAGNVKDGTIVRWKIKHGTTSAADFSRESGALTITAEAATATITVVGDAVWENEESFQVELWVNGNPGTLAATTQAVRIKDTSMDMYTACCIFEYGVDAGSLFVLGRK